MPLTLVECTRSNGEALLLAGTTAVGYVGAYVYFCFGEYEIVLIWFYLLIWSEINANIVLKYSDNFVVFSSESCFYFVIFSSESLL